MEQEVTGSDVGIIAIVTAVYNYAVAPNAKNRAFIPDSELIKK